MNATPKKSEYVVNQGSNTGNRQLCQFIFLLSLSAIMLLMPLSQARGQEGADKNSILLTIFLRHDQSKTLEEIQAHLKKTGFDKNFPPVGTEIVSWYVMMGIGQVVTLRVPPEKLREVNVAVEKGAWGAFRSEFYPTYDYRPVWEAQRKAP
jgi:hypothetical protein